MHFMTLILLETRMISDSLDHNGSSNQHRLHPSHSCSCCSYRYHRILGASDIFLPLYLSLYCLLVLLKHPVVLEIEDFDALHVH